MRRQAKASAAPADEQPQILNESGEMLLPLDGQLYVARPSRKAIGRVERQLRPLFLLAEDARRNALSLNDMAIVTAEFMAAYAEANPNERGVVKSPDVDRLEDLIMDAGVVRICARLYFVLYGAVTGGYTPSGERKAGAAAP